MTQNESDIFNSMPESIKALSDRTGALLPAGAVIYAEGDTRNFHELLFIYHGIIRKQNPILKGTAESLREILFYYAERSRGWYALSELSQAIARVLNEADFNDASDLLDHIEKLMVVSGQTNSWIDLLIPWHRINQIMRSEPRKHAGNGETL